MYSCGVQGVPKPVQTRAWLLIRLLVHTSIRQDSKKGTLLTSIRSM